MEVNVDFKIINVGKSYQIEFMYVIVSLLQW